MSTGTNTINPQTGAVNVPTPKTIKKAREEVYAGISFKWFVIITIWALVSMLGTIPYFIFHNNMLIQCFIVAMQLVWWGIYATNFRTVDMFDATLLKLSFMWDHYCGLHTISPYTMKVKFLEKKFPLKDIHSRGLIEFTNKRYGLLIGYTAPKVNPQDKHVHDLNVQKVLDRLTGDMMLAFITASRHSMRGPIVRKITKKMDEKNIPKHIYKYLYSMYQHVVSKKKLTPTWDFYIFFGLGTLPNLEEAYSKMDSELPGLMDALENANMLADVFKDPQEIAKHYRQFCIPEKIPAGVCI